MNAPWLPGRRFAEPTIRAVGETVSLLDDLAAALAQDADAAEQAPPAPVDPEAQIADLVDAHRAQVAASRARVAETRRRERERVKAIEAEIARLKELIAEERAEARRSIAADQRLIAIGKAALQAAEEGLE